MHMFTVWLTCREHLLVEARGSDRYIKVSNVRDLRWQVRHCTVDLNCPWNRATMMDSFSSLCLLQARSAAVWSSRWSFSSSLYRFLLSALHHRQNNNNNIMVHRNNCSCRCEQNLPSWSNWSSRTDTEYTDHNYNTAVSIQKEKKSMRTTDFWVINISNLFQPHKHALSQFTLIMIGRKIWKGRLTLAN